MSPRHEPTDCELREFARRIYEDRRRRYQLFDVRIFGEPAWDMLLVLYGGEMSGPDANVTCLAKAANVPQSTAVRWQSVLIEEGLIELTRLGRSFTGAVVLTPTGHTLMERYLLRSLASDERPPCCCRQERGWDLLEP